MASVFIKVPIEVDHIAQMRMFFTESDEDVYGVCYLNGNTLEWECVDSFGDVTKVTHTVKKIELPTEEEVFKSSTGWKEETQQECYILGVSFVLSKLKGGNNG